MEENEKIMKNTRGRKEIRLKKGTDEHTKARKRWKEIIKIIAQIHEFENETI
jgi:hypothetical protein